MVVPRFKAVVFLALGATALAQQSAPDVDALKQLSLEQLMNVEVTSVSRSPEPLFDAPAAIQVITNGDIADSSATSLPEALRLASNLEVAQENSHDWAISARGFDADLGDKLLVLIDGRAVYTPLYGGVLWNTQGYLLEDIDRIEVISGPAGTEWGANAVNGVINIDTKSARDTQGLYVREAAGGAELQDQTAIRYGGTLAPDVYYRVYAQYTDRASELLPGGAGADDTFDMLRGGFRVDSYAVTDTTLTLQGDAYHGTEYLADGDEGLEGGNVLARWTRTMANDSQATLWTYFDHTYLSLPYPASPASPPYYSGFPASALVDSLGTFDVDFEDRIGSDTTPNRLVWGGEYRYSHETDTDQNLVQFIPATEEQSLITAFVEDSVAVGPAVRLTAGTKVEHNAFTGWELEPSLRAQWNMAPRQMLWAAVSRAVRTPARYDRDLVVFTGLENPPPPYVFPEYYLTGSPKIGSETLIAYELGYRAEVTPTFSLSVSNYFNDYDHLESTAATPTTATYPFALPVVFENGLRGQTYGTELAADYQLASWWRLHAGYDYLHEHIYNAPGYQDTTDGMLQTADPRNQWSLRSDFRLGSRVRFDADWRWVDKLTIAQSPTSGTATGTVPAYQEMDARLSWMIFSRLELSLVGQNLLHRYHLEYGYSDPTTEEIRRNVFAEAEWRY